MIRIFLSHSSQRKALVREIKNKLPEHIRSWIDEVNLLPGENIGRSIKTVIHQATDFVIIFIDARAVESQWVLQELAWARKREQSLQREFILPIVLDRRAWPKVKSVLGNRKYIECHDETEDTVRKVSRELADALWAWLVRLVEPSLHTQVQTGEQDLVAAFWEPYLTSSKAVRIFYPEPQFFRDEKHTYMRSQYADLPGQQEAFSYLNIPGGLVPSYSFVSSGIVKALLYLVDCLHAHRVKVTTRPLRPVSAFDDADENVIILGTPGMLDVIKTLEASYPFHTIRDGVTVSAAGNGMAKGTRTRFTDDTQENFETSKVRLKKWAVFTRRPHAYRDNITTILAAPHGRSIEAIAGFLTRSTELRDLLHQVATRDGFPRYMQVLFSVPMLKTDGEPHIDPPRIHKAINLDHAKKSKRRRGSA